jgi:uncharacterized protein YdhG (YjbR/CyaY superfamily)
MKPTSVSQYIQAYPKDVQKKLKEMRSCVLSCAPDAIEGLRWGMPAISHKRILVTYAAFKKHIGLYPTPSAITAFEKQLLKYKTAKGSIQFPLDEPLPLPLIKKIVTFRVKESLKEDKKWKEGCN